MKIIKRNLYSLDRSVQCNTLQFVAMQNLKCIRKKINSDTSNTNNKTKG